MKNFVRYGGRIPLVAPAGGVVSGLGYLIGALFCVAEASAAAGETFTGQIDDVVTLPKATGALAQGALVYWDNTAKNVTATSAGNTKIGYAAAAQISADTTVQVLLVPV
jgi:predicted RecA/RadA family phage recombinase